MELYQFRDPGLPERDVLMLILHQMTQLRGDVKMLSELMLSKNVKVEDVDKIYLKMQQRAFEDLEEITEVFRRRKQNPEQN